MPPPRLLRLCCVVLVCMLQVVAVRFDELNVEDHASCGPDSVSLRDGSSANSLSLGRFCTDAGSVLTSSGPSLLVIFQTDDSANTGRFALSWTFVSQGSCFTSVNLSIDTTAIVFTGHISTLWVGPVRQDSVPSVTTKILHRVRKKDTTVFYAKFHRNSVTVTISRKFAISAELRHKNIVANILATILPPTDIILQRPKFPTSCHVDCYALTSR